MCSTMDTAKYPFIDSLLALRSLSSTTFKYTDGTTVKFNRLKLSNRPGISVCSCNVNVHMDITSEKNEKSVMYKFPENIFIIRS